MSEFLLLAAFLLLLIIPQFYLRKINQPRRTYIRLAAACILMILTWLFSDAHMGLKLLLTVVALSGALMTLREYRKMKISHSERERIDAGN